jgi:hypothetical protein
MFIEALFIKRFRQMNFQRVVAKVSKGDLHYALGRFRTVRLAYGGMRRLTDGRVPMQGNGPQHCFLMPTLRGLLKSSPKKQCSLA